MAPIFTGSKFGFGRGAGPVSPAFSATGGTIIDEDGYRFHVFSNPASRIGESGTFTITVGSRICDILVVAGGGSGGNANEGHGGGGAGGMVDFPSGAPQNVALIPGSYPVTYGSGGLAPGPVAAQGTDSSFGGAPFGTLTGKGGGAYNVSGGAGGSGSGGRGDSPQTGPATQPSQPGLSGTYGYGNPGGSGVGPEQGEGGGGAGGAGGGSPANGFGGAGRKPPWIPNSGAFGANGGYFAGGGGAGVRSPGPTGGPGGIGGGGRGYRDNPTSPDINGVNGTGGGAGGGQENSVVPGSGGSGVVIIRYQL